MACVVSSVFQVKEKLVIVSKFINNSAYLIAMWFGARPSVLLESCRARKGLNQACTSICLL